MRTITVILTIGAAALQASPPYRIAQTFALGGDGGWDYIVPDPPSHRIYIGRSNRVMRDTGFAVPQAARDRRAGLCGFDDEGHLTPLSAAPGRQALDERPDGMTFESGGQGLWSTLDDYLAFARMLIGEGANGAQLPRRETLAMMTSNQLSPQQRAAARMFGRPLFAKGHGYGMGVAVVMEPETADLLRGRGGLGTIGWPGAYGGWWQADPTDRSVLILLAHNMVELHQMAKGIGLGVWEAIERFHTLATT